MLEKIKGIGNFFKKGNFTKTKLVIALILATLLAIIFEYKIYSIIENIIYMLKMMWEILHYKKLFQRLI